MSLEQAVQIAQKDSSISRFSSPPSPISIMSANPPNTAVTPSFSTTGLVVPPFTIISSPSPSIDGHQPQSPPSVNSDTHSLNGEPGSPSATIPNLNPNTEVDPQILEALRSKDRIYVLKLGELMEGLINDRRSRVELTPTTSYQRLLVHRCSAYYKLVPENEPGSKGISVVAVSESRIPARRLCDLVPAESTAQPAFKIMRRSLPDRRSKSQSQAGSVAGEDADFSDVEPSEAGSLGGRSNATGGSSKKRMTIEERAAAYEEARSRIFGFEDKDKDKEKDMSASSSSLSLVSGSTSAGGGSSSVGDLDDATSSPATESEWSGPVNRDKKDPRRGSGNGSAASSSRSLRSSAPPFNNGSGSTRNSRAPSPSFTYATLYEPPPSVLPYDPGQHSGHHPNPGFQQSQYLYPYPPAGQPTNQSFHPQYSYYPPYNGYQSQPPHPQQNVTDPSLSNADAYPPPIHGNSYGWPHPNQPPLHSPPQMQQHSQPPLQQPRQNLSHVGMSPPAQNPPHFQPYMAHSHPYGYSMPGYYPPQPGQQHIPPPPHMSVQPVYDVPRPMNGSMVGNNGGNHNNNMGGRVGLGNGVIIPPDHSRSSARNNIGPGPMANSNGKLRGPVPPPPRAAWSYGPGIGMGGYVSPVGSGGDVLGPRMNSVRRQSGNSTSSSGNNRSPPTSNGDDVSSTASSSTTSSSSRRTYTSATSSHHPLPPRPDWAVGLKPSTSYAPHNRQYDHSLTTSRTMSPITPPHNLNSGSVHSSISTRQGSSQPTLQSNDFPPLTSVAATPEKRLPPVAGAWGNTSSTRSILMSSSSNALVQHPGVAGGAMNNGTKSNTRLEEPDRGFERPLPKSAELFNPKVVRRPINSNGNVGMRAQADARGDVVASAILVGHIGSLSLDGQGAETSPVSTTRDQPATLALLT